MMTHHFFSERDKPDTVSGELGAASSQQASLRGGRHPGIQPERP